MATNTVTVSSFSNVSNNFSDGLDETKTVSQRVQDILYDPLNIVLIVLSFIGLLANSLSIAATLHIPHGQTTHSKLIINLAVSDICIILSVFLHVLVAVLSPLHINEYCFEVANQEFLNFSLLAILINLLAMGLDHYIAIMKPLHYHEIMSRCRGNLMLILIWIISLTGGLLDLIVGAFWHDGSNDFCETVYRDGFDAQIFIFGLVLLELLVLIYLYLQIFLEVKKLLVRGQAMHQDDMHNKKAIVTTLLIIGTFMICLAPNSVFQITIQILLRTDRQSVMDSIPIILLIHQILWILMLANSLCDPIIYALRLRDVQRGYRCMLWKLCKRSRPKNSHCHARRNTARMYMSDTDNSNDYPVAGRNGMIPTPDSDLPMPESDSNETTKILSDNGTDIINHKCCPDKTADVDINKRLLIHILEDEKKTDMYQTHDDDIVSELTDLTPVSVLSNETLHHDTDDKEA